MNRRVVHLSSAHPAEDTRIFVKECRTLAAAGYDTHIVISTAHGYEKDGVKFHALAQRPGRFYRMCVKPLHAYRAVRALAPDVLHVHEPDLLPLAWLFARRGVHVIYDSHEDLPRQIPYKDWIPAPLRGPIARIVEWFEDGICRSLAGVVAATPHIADRFYKAGVNAVCVANFPNLSELAMPAGESWDAREKSVAYIGTISVERGVNELLQAAKIADVKIHIAGFPHPAALGETLKSAHERGEIVYHGAISRDAVLDLMRTLRGGIVCFHPLPNHVDAQPNKLFEYMSAGLPVIASHFPLWREIIEKSGCGICVDPNKPRAIAEAIRYILDHDWDAKAMGERGQNAVRERYNWEVQADILLAFYRDILKEAV
ncbi:MAG: glycosyltransferase family 4 protein [Rhodospirillales bacterium]|nr:glycosyltransferase family 4 protein [Alphaproteobacteria bacterium]MCB9986247.1 glycosyltransferase family 4 protein [Rhodospirillales bacterium]USO07198.1 MAG: glycosyltransferase family 4 protein [Rhodospirillales bacterium]